MKKNWNSNQLNQFNANLILSRVNKFKIDRTYNLFLNEFSNLSLHKCQDFEFCELRKKTRIKFRLTKLYFTRNVKTLECVNVVTYLLRVLSAEWPASTCTRCYSWWPSYKGDLYGDLYFNPELSTTSIRFNQMSQFPLKDQNVDLDK